MKPISVNVDEEDYRALKSAAERLGRPVAELIREAMVEYLTHRSGSSGSLFDLTPHPSGALSAPWTRSEILDEKLEKLTI
ncbi:MAG TPA: ribbon-helix-helix protein, CopG family [Thermoanaerobaculia bacterium]|nr:ribbon-helix-helix protein, CopG family [Thermoanaerobaculia bacterium]